jgi:hypothetical protein
MAAVTGPRVVAAVALGAALGSAGCGHDVEPTDGFSDPASIPLCCVDDPGPSCCSLDAFAFVNGVALSWNSEDRIFAYIDGWILYRAEGSSVPDAASYHRLNPSLILERTYVDPDVEDGLDYWYRLASLSPAGVESLPTEPIRVRVDMTPPAAPSGLQAAATQTRVTLTWNANTEPDLDHYNVIRDPELPPAAFFSVPREEFQDDWVVPGASYRYWVLAVDHGLNVSAPSETLTVVVPGP